jgi:integrase
MAGQKVKLPKRVNGWTDQHGRSRYYLRLPGQKAVPLPGLPWSPVMMNAIEAAMVGQPVPMTALPIGAARTKPGTLNEAIVRFYEHEQFLNLGRAHQMRHRQVLEKFRQADTADNVPRGERQLQTLSYDRLAKILAGMESPHGQRHLLNGLRALMRFAKLTGLVQLDPCDGLKGKRRAVTGGFMRAAEDEIAQYQAHHALGTMPRLALELMLNTGLRRSDAVLLSRQHIRAGVITLKPQKTRNVTGVTVTIPVHSDLQAALDAMPPRQAKPGETTPLALLHTSFGKPYTAAGFGNWFRDQCVTAGVEFRAHGLRKAICIRLVRQGMTPHQVAAITGHKDLREIELYAREFDREFAARQAMAALEKRKAKR